MEVCSEVFYTRCARSLSEVCGVCGKGHGRKTCRGQRHWLDVDVDEDILRTGSASESNDQAQAADVPNAILLRFLHVLPNLRFSVKTVCLSSKTILLPLVLDVTDRQDNCDIYECQTNGSRAMPRVRHLTLMNCSSLYMF